MVTSINNESGFWLDKLQSSFGLLRKRGKKKAYAFLDASHGLKRVASPLDTGVASVSTELLERVKATLSTLESVKGNLCKEQEAYRQQIGTSQVWALKFLSVGMAGVLWRSVLSWILVS